MEFRILGPMEVVDEGRVLTIGGPKQRALLSCLLLAPNRVVAADRLVDALWSADPPEGAANALQYHVSQLRKLIGRDLVETRPPGYLLHVRPDQLDLFRFEQLVADAGCAEPDRASELLRAALELWFGDPLADVADEPFAELEAQRLQELRLVTLEQRIETDLALGRHRQLVPEVEALLRRHPLRERLTAALMRAHYGAGRQAAALEVYRATRGRLSSELGIEPSPALRELERAILRHDPELRPHSDGHELGAVLVVTGDERGNDGVLSVATALAASPPREVIVARLLRTEAELPAAGAALEAARSRLAARGIRCRVAAYTTAESGTDAALLATEQNVALVLVPVPNSPDGGLESSLASLLQQVPCDVALVRPGEGVPGGPVVTPFGGAEHDWSAIELAAWLASSLGASLRLLGTAADGSRRDASRLLARASLLVQQLVGVRSDTMLIAPGHHAVVDAAEGAQALVVGLSDRWRSEGIGTLRSRIAAGATVPTLFVRHGPRPGGLAPPETLTRFTWTLAADGD